VADLRLSAVRTALAAIAAITVLAASGCAAPTSGRSSVAPAAVPSATPTPSPTGSAPAGGPAAVGAGGSALAFDLPADGGYRPAGRRVADDGATVRQWRTKAGRAGLYCVVIAGEQPSFHGDFPAAALAAFRAGHDLGGSILVNRATPAIRGTVSGVRQQSRYVFSLGRAGNANGVLLIQQYLTTAGTLISLNAAGPGDDADRCGLAGIVDSLRVSTAADQAPSASSAAGSAGPTATPAGPRARPTPNGREPSS
jgi:hypothetical protein